MSTQRTVDPAALVAAARGGDPEAQDALVSAYLPLVYNIVGRALNGSVDVDDVVQETMLRTLDGLGGLRTPESFRSWLVAIAMNEVRKHWHDRGPAAGGVEEAVELADPGADFVDLTLVQLQLSGQRQETARATRWLEPDDRGLLSLWWLECAGELTRTEVAAALELSAQHTAVRVQRMKAQLEAARVVVRALDAQPPCPELRGMLGAWDGRPSALWRKRIARHARGCVRCSGLWSGLMPAEGLLAGLALVAVAPLLRENVRVACGAMAEAGMAVEGPAAGAAAPRRHGGHRAGRRRNVSRSEARRRRRNRRRAVGGAVVAACVAGGGLWYFGTDNGTGGTEGTTAERAADAPVADLSESSAAEPSPSVSASAPPSPSRTRKATAPATTHPAKKAAPTPRASATPTRSPLAAPQASSTPSDTVAQVVALVNQERAKAGCGALTEDPQLEEAAQGHSDDMAARDFFDHTNPDGADPGQRITAAGYRWSTYGENIAQGQQTPQAVMESWMNSPGHRANILNCSFKDIGVGVHRGSGGPWWTQDFGAKL
ncbi:sigma-70 family RNA polymerase sigma factor [Streptomyces sp. NPDC101225]|uniref:sigma-70 family RNA polymerase sigma factor n=1 Tax=Streptomyces sp. NPDC101225 TaxID=3366135 RepID=UPI0037FD8A71